MPGTWVRSVVQEEPTYQGATKTVLTATEPPAPEVRAPQQEEPQNRTQEQSAAGESPHAATTQHSQK